MELLSNQSGTALAIPAAAEFLAVTEKTVRNYINRGILRATKWNGSWRIPADSIQEVHWSKYGRPAELPVVAAEPLQETETKVESNLTVPQRRYDELVRQAVTCATATDGSARLRDEMKHLYERIAQLEASAASGWTEARQYKEQLMELRDDLGQSQSDCRSCQEEARKRQAESDHLRTELAAASIHLTGRERELSLYRSRAVAQDAELREVRSSLQALKIKYLKA